VRELTAMGVAELCRRRDAGEFGSEEILAAHRFRIETVDAELHAVAHHFREEGPAEGPLRGIPYLTKANIAVRGRPHDCGSRILAGYVAPFDATVTARLHQSGCSLVGSTNMDEFGMGSSTEHSCQGPTHNPADRSRTPGGSSGGSAAAVAAGMVPFALGTDTGGSVRQPAAHCGVYGLRPTWGRVSRYGLTTFASSMDQVGILARAAEDLPLIFSVIAGVDPRDATTRAPELTSRIARRFTAPRLAVDPSTLEIVDDEVGGAFEAFVRDLESAGVRIDSVSLPSCRVALECYLVLSSAEAASNLARFDGTLFGDRVTPAQSYEEMVRMSRSQGFGAEVKRRILSGVFASSAGEGAIHAERARALRRQIRLEHVEVLRECDALLLPTTPTAAPRLGEYEDDPCGAYEGDRLTTPASLAGLPAVAMPISRGPRGLPLSAQLVGRPDQDEALLDLAIALARMRSEEEPH
jgi:aspartyl-tRNA(Asn)/glutamyl-tRNA(Gln) amidotransferase subunit A